MDQSKNYMIITLGTRDITLDGYTFDEIKEHKRIEDEFTDDMFWRNKLLPRPAGKVILNRFDYYKDRLDYPIVKKALEYVIGKVGEIKKLYIIYTDQDEGVAEKYRNNDTVYFAQLVEKLIQKTYNNIKNKPIQGYKKVKVSTSGITYLDEMLTYWKKQFTTKYFNCINPRDKIFILPIGGIDSINIGLLLAAILTWKEGCRQIYFTEGKSVRKLNFVDQLMFELKKDKIIHYLDNYNYAGIADILCAEQKTDSLRIVYLLAEYAKQRLYFNLDEADAILDIIFHESMNYRDLEDALSKDIINLKTNEEYRMKELFFNAFVKYRQGQYVDFLLRMFRVEESIYRYYVEKYLNIDTSNSNGYNGFRNSIKEHQDLHCFVSQQKVNGSDLKIDQPNNKNLFHIFRYLIEVNKDVHGQKILDEDMIVKLTLIKECATKISSLSNLRNNSIGAHGFDGVSRSKIEHVLNQPIEDFFTRLGSVLGLEYTNNSYTVINDKIYNILKNINI